MKVASMMATASYDAEPETTERRRKEASYDAEKRKNVKSVVEGIMSKSTKRKKNKQQQHKQLRQQQQQNKTTAHTLHTFHTYIHSIHYIRTYIRIYTFTVNPLWGSGKECDKHQLL